MIVNKLYAIHFVLLYLYRLKINVFNQYIDIAECNISLPLTIPCLQTGEDNENLNKNDKVNKIFQHHSIIPLNRLYHKYSEI